MRLLKLLKMENKIFVSYIFIMFIFFSSCSIVKKSSTGFTKEYSLPKKRILSLKTVIVEKKINISGWFVELKKDNRALTLFVPIINKKKIDFKKIINSVELSNNPNQWPFYYSIFGAISIDSVAMANIKTKNSYNFNKTIIEQNKPFVQKKKKVKKYIIEYHYQDSATFCLASVETSEINEYNTTIRIQDGTYLIKPNTTPTYLFDERNNRMKFLLAESEFCK